VGDHRGVEERVGRAVIAVGLGVEDVAERAAPLDLRLEAERVARLVRAVDQDEAVGREDEAVVRAALFRLDQNVGREVLMGRPSSWRWG
jgi:hypothetical protein